MTKKFNYNGIEHLFYTVTESFDIVINNNKSFIRLGDGEFFRLYKPNKMVTAFEKNNDEFNKKFKNMYENIKNNNLGDNIYVCYPMINKYICNFAFKYVSNYNTHLNAYMCRALNDKTLYNKIYNYLINKKNLLVISYIDNTNVYNFKNIFTHNKKYTDDEIYNIIKNIFNDINITNIFNDNYAITDDTLKLYSLINSYKIYEHIDKKVMYKLLVKFIKSNKKTKKIIKNVHSLYSIKSYSKIINFVKDKKHNIIRTPYINSYKEYDNIKNKILQYSNDNIVLFFNGPIGKLMNYELTHDSNYVCWDMGHFLSD